MGDYTVKRIDEMEAAFRGGFRRARAELGVESFGMQIIEMPPGYGGYPEHDHAGDGQEEVYVVLEGTAEAEVAGKRIVADAGCMLWVSPASRRRLLPGPYGARVLAIGRAPEGAYERPGGFRLAARP